ncbi:cytochrome P450 [Cubamyces lactineus]|nr:cytochrome P450 [Cubamyces lactineus]
MAVGVDNLVVPLLLLCFFYATRKFIAFQRSVRQIKGWPGFRTLFNETFIFFPFPVRGISPGPQRSFYTKHNDFAKAGWDVLSAVSAFPQAKITYYIADAAVIQEILGARSRFPKPTEAYQLLAAFGSNILVTEGDVWKRQRKIAAPAFSERNNRLVWDETINIVEDMFKNVWGDKDVVEVGHILDMTVAITQLVIGIAAFGRRMSWKEDSVARAGHTMTFKEALYDVSHNLFLRILFPPWLLRYGTPRMRRFATAYNEMDAYLREMVQERRSATYKEARYDLFTNLLDANEGEADSKAKLTDSELLGNVFIYLVAGYETSAHTLSYAFIFLALYQDEQEKLYENIKSVLPDGRTPTYDEMGSLSYAMAVFNETLRHFPPVSGIPKHSAEDTSFTTTSATGEKATYSSSFGPNQRTWWTSNDHLDKGRALGADTRPRIMKDTHYTVSMLLLFSSRSLRCANVSPANCGSSNTSTLYRMMTAVNIATDSVSANLRHPGNRDTAAHTGNQNAERRNERTVVVQRARAERECTGKRHPAWICMKAPIERLQSDEPVVIVQARWWPWYG